MGYSGINLRPWDVYSECNSGLVVMISFGQGIDTGWVKVSAHAQFLFIAHSHLFAHLLSPEYTAHLNLHYPIMHRIKEKVPCSGCCSEYALCRAALHSGWPLAYDQFQFLCLSLG